MPDNHQQPNTPSAPSHKVVWERDTLERLAFATLTEQRASRRWRIQELCRLRVGLDPTGVAEGSVGARQGKLELAEEDG